jgi:hypothetical protein
MSHLIHARQTAIEEGYRVAAFPKGGMAFHCVGSGCVEG